MNILPIPEKIQSWEIGRAFCGVIPARAFIRLRRDTLQLAAERNGEVTAP
jgi:hypothetical protein